MSELDLQDNSSLGSVSIIESEKSPEQRENEKNQERETYELAALHEHPGWKQIKEMFENDIESLRMLKEINMQKYSNEELGEVARDEHRLADRLSKYLNKVDEAARAVANGRNGT